MSEQPPVCKVCGKLCSAHTVQLRWGIAHAGTYNEHRRFDSCSERHADYQHTWGRIAELETLVRSLRWHAGRLRTKGRAWTPDDLVERSDKAVKTIETLRRVIAEYYPWALKED